MPTYKTTGVCSRQISFEVEDGRLKAVHFQGGCPGNLKALSTLLEGMPVADAVKKLKGITCGDKSTSCSDQLAIALTAYNK
jgi:uncharacterized protein (TIGR03905 family)